MAEMIIHFICRGNSFRSIIAEAYLKSRRLDGLKVISSGTNAAADKAGNLASHGRTLGRLVTLPPRTQVWSVADIGEPGRIARTETEKTLFRQEAYQEIVAAVSRLISEISPEASG